MGGTSFDTGIISDNEIHIEKNLQLGPFQTGVNLVDVVSVGAGGGSIAWVSERGVPQVGPHSAGSTPGPAALGRGGEEPTVTDAMVTLGLHRPRQLPRRPRRSCGPSWPRDGAGRAFGARFGWSVEEAAAAVHDLVVVNMANAVREVSVGKGHDPRDFLFLAYGGTLPLFASQIAERLGDRHDRDPAEQLRVLRARAAGVRLRAAQRPGRRLGPEQAGAGRPRQRDRRPRWSTARGARWSRRGVRRATRSTFAAAPTSASRARPTS